MTSAVVSELLPAIWRKSMPAMLLGVVTFAPRIVLGEDTSARDALDQYLACRDQCTKYSIVVDSTLQSVPNKMHLQATYRRDGARRDIIEELPIFDAPPPVADEANGFARTRLLCDGRVAVRIHERSSETEYLLDLSGIERRNGELELTRMMDLREVEDLASYRLDLSDAERERNETHIGSMMDFSPIEGFLAQDTISFPMLLKRAENLRISETPEDVGGVACLLLTATVTHFGKYSVWLAPSHQWRVMKALVEKGPGDVFGTYILGKASGIDNVKWELVDVSYGPAGSQRIPEGFKTITVLGKTLQERVFKIHDVNLDPDYTAGDYFFDAIPADALLRTYYDAAAYRRENGRFVPCTAQ